MFILWGVKTFNRKKSVSKAEMHCENCGMYNYWELADLWTWFTLFFIPLFPVHKKSMVACPRCGSGIKLTKKNRDEIMSQF